MQLRTGIVSISSSDSELHDTKRGGSFGAAEQSVDIVDNSYKRLTPSDYAAGIEK